MFHGRVLRPAEDAEGLVTNPLAPTVPWKQMGVKHLDTFFNSGWGVNRTNRKTGVVLGHVFPLCAALSGHSGVSNTLAQ